MEEKELTTTSEVSSAVTVQEPEKFKTLAEAQSAYDADAAASEALLAENAEEIAGLKAALEAKRAELDAAENLGKDLDERCGALEKEVEDLKETAKSVEEKAAAMVAATGTEPEPIALEDNAPQSLEDAWKEYDKKTSSKEKRNFYLSEIKPLLG